MMVLSSVTKYLLVFRICLDNAGLTALLLRLFYDWPLLFLTEIQVRTIQTFCKLKQLLFLFVWRNKNIFYEMIRCLIEMTVKNFTI